MSEECKQTNNNNKKIAQHEQSMIQTAHIGYPTHFTTTTNNECKCVWTTIKSSGCSSSSTYLSKVWIASVYHTLFFSLFLLFTFPKIISFVEIILRITILSTPILYNLTVDTLCSGGLIQKHFNLLLHTVILALYFPLIWLKSTLAPCYIIWMTDACNAHGVIF